MATAQYTGAVLASMELDQVKSGLDFCQDQRAIHGKRRPQLLSTQCGKQSKKQTPVFQSKLERNNMEMNQELP